MKNTEGDVVGWCNYIIIPKLKIIIETSRYLDDKDYRDDMRNLLDMLSTTDYDAFGKSLTELDISSFANIVKIAENSAYLFSYGDIETDELLLMWLQLRGIDYEILSEFQFKKENYPDYVILKRGDDDE